MKDIFSERKKNENVFSYDNGAERWKQKLLNFQIGKHLFSFLVISFGKNVFSFPPSNSGTEIEIRNNNKKNIFWYPSLPPPPHTHTHNTFCLLR